MASERLIIVTGFEHPASYDTVVVFTGVDDELGAVRFGADHRVATILMRAIAEGVDPVAEVPDWAML